MSGMSRAEILAWMSGKTKTLGWNSIVSYDRSRVNKVLGDEYVLKTGEGNIVDPMSGPAEVLGGVVEVSNLTLGNPLMSFYDSTLNDSKVNLQMPLMGGSFTTYEGADEEQYHVVEYNTIQPGDELFVDMIVSLSNTQGTVNDKGEVLLNLGEAVDWKVNFGDSEDVENALGIFIQNEYTNAPEENKKYLLGMIDINGDDPLTPVSFAIRTQPEPESDNGGGAVVMFIKTKADESAADPGLPIETSDFEYLIPNDVDESGNGLYSGSVLIGSKTLFEDILSPHYKYSNGGTVSFLTKNLNGEENSSKMLVGNDGYILANSVEKFWGYDDGISGAPMWYWQYLRTWVSGGDLSVAHQGQVPSQGVSIFPSDNNLRSTWSFSYPQPTSGSLTMLLTPDRPEYETGNVTATAADAWYEAKTTVDKNNIVRFEKIAENNNVSVSGTEWLYNSSQNYDHGMIDQYIGDLQWYLHVAVDQFQNTPIPGIDVFTLSNLLFPGQDVLQLKDSALPGDLACFGNINPALTSYMLDPVQKTVAVNSSTTFVLKDGSGAAISGAVWSVQAVNGGISGSINSTTGVYTAPVSISPGMTTHQDIVKAVFNGITSQSLVTVVNGMQVTPAFKKVTSYDTAMPEEGKVLLSATNMENASSIQWEIELVDGVPGLGSLEPHADGSHKIWFIPPTEEAMGSKELTCAIVKAVDTATLQESRSSILTHASGDTLEVIVKHMKEDAAFDVYFPLLSSGQAATMGLFIDGEENEYPQNFTWKVESGGGTLETLPPVVGGGGKNWRDGPIGLQWTSLTPAR
ncbi:hypothetical protein ACJCHP_004516 [Enterobacter asburiae]